MNLDAVLVFRPSPFDGFREHMDRFVLTLRVAFNPSNEPGRSTSGSFVMNIGIPCRDSTRPDAEENVGG